MSTDFQRLDCKSGCQMSRMQFLHEQEFLTMNDVLNNLQTEHIELCNYLEDHLLPLLEYYAVKGDLDAQDCLMDLYDFV